jgi:small-conductance mechanosensitive channel
MGKLWDILRTFFNEHDVAQQAFSTVLLVASVLVLRVVLRRLVSRANIPSPDLRRRWVVAIRNATLVLLIIGLIIIWATQLRTLAVSLVAFAAVVVLCLKEVIMCVTGSLLKVGSRPFVLGDRIEVGNFRGEVIDQTLLTTTLLEIGPGPSAHQTSGRRVTLPNALFLNTAVINESIAGEYTVHAFVVPVKRADDPVGAEQQLLESAKEIVQPYIEMARKQMARLASVEGVDSPSVDPRVIYTLPDGDRVDLIVRVPVPVDGKRLIQQQIIRRFIEKRYGSKPKDTAA